MGKNENSGFFRHYCSQGPIVVRCRKLIEFMKVCEYEGQGLFFTIYFQVLYVLCFTRPRYKGSVYRTIGPQVFSSVSVTEWPPFGK